MSQDLPSRAHLWEDWRARLAVLLMCLAALLLYVVLASPHFFGNGGSENETSAAGIWARGCPSDDAPKVDQINRKQLPELRAATTRVMRGRHGRVYEVGIVNADVVWSDNSPQPGAVAFRLASSAPAAYEMRWWAPNKDDVVADVFVFLGSGEARDFFDRASSPRCRTGSSNSRVVQPLNARDLAWINPDKALEQDIFLVRGRRVYRIVDVPPVSRYHNKVIRGLRTTFHIINELGCGLPLSGCEPSGLWLNSLNAHRSS